MAEYIHAIWQGSEILLPYGFPGDMDEKSAQASWLFGADSDAAVGMAAEEEAESQASVGTAGGTACVMKVKNYQTVIGRLRV